MRQIKLTLAAALALMSCAAMAQYDAYGRRVPNEAEMCAQARAQGGPMTTRCAQLAWAGVSALPPQQAQYAAPGQQAAPQQQVPGYENPNFYAQKRKGMKLNGRYDTSGEPLVDVDFAPYGYNALWTNVPFEYALRLTDDSSYRRDAMNYQKAPKAGQGVRKVIDGWGVN